VAIVPVSKMTNALVEIGLISVSVVLGIAGLSPWVIVVMVGVSLAWWAFVHTNRLSTMMKSGTLGAVGQVGLTLLALVGGHGVGFALGGAFHAILGLK
jgi:sterol desaturase/sphingolipid hydroxylase (fatty acid hydroxylase superfamily)